MSAGRRFYKMSGSGNDFVVFDSSDGDSQHLSDPLLIRRLCNRRQGIGADGLVILEPSRRADVLMKYFNSDGSRGAMCGNAALCVTRLLSSRGQADPAGMLIETDDGLVRSRIVEGRPEIELSPVQRLRDAVEPAKERGERRWGYAVVGVPHVVVLCDDIEEVDLQRRGPTLRHAEWTGPDGANVNFVSGQPGPWRIRTYERGVEAETLACGTGAVATATLLRAWGLAGSETALLTRSGCTLDVVLHQEEGRLVPRLRGEARLVFEGRLGEV